MPRRSRRSKTNKKRKGYKAFDPFCGDKVRVALYNRPNGPHMGKIIANKTELSGLDNKCFSRTGRIKKGYRNIPVDLERDFEIEKRRLSKLKSIFDHKLIKKPRNKNNENDNIMNQTLDNAKRMPNESLSSFINRVNKLEYDELHKESNKLKEKILKKRLKRQLKIQKKINEKFSIIC